MKVLLIDDHPLILAALQGVIQGLGDNVTVVGADTAAAAQQALLAQATEGEFDLVLLDLHIGNTNGFDLLAEFREAYPALPVVVVSASDRSSDVIRAIDMGAMGFVPKRSSNEQLTEALRLVMSGGIYVPPMTLGVEGGGSGPADAETVPGYLRVVGDEGGRPGGVPAPASLASLNLTPRQKDVLALLLQGLPNKMIARELGLSAETVKDHVAGVLRALGVSSRTQAVLAVSQMSQRAGGFISALRQPRH